MNKLSKLQQVVEQEIKDKARNTRNEPHHSSIAGAHPDQLRAELGRQALEKFDYEFKRVLGIWFNEGVAKDFVAIPKAFAKHPYLGNSTVLKELCLCMAGVGGNNSDLVEELVIEYRFDGSKPQLEHKLLFIQESAKPTDAELFWLSVLAYHLKEITPAFKKLMLARLFSKQAVETIDDIDFHKGIDSGTKEEVLSEMDACILLQYTTIAKLCERL